MEKFQFEKLTFETSRIDLLGPISCIGWGELLWSFGLGLMPFWFWISTCCLFLGDSPLDSISLDFKSINWSEFSCCELLKRHNTFTQISTDDELLYNWDFEEILLWALFPIYSVALFLKQKNITKYDRNKTKRKAFPGTYSRKIKQRVQSTEGPTIATQKKNLEISLFFLWLLHNKLE